MRVAQVVLSLGMGGQEQLVVRIAHALRARGHDPHVVTLTPGGARLYDLSAYQSAFSMLFAWGAVALVALAFTRETHCRQAA